jgi:hypothetical protein
MESYKITKQELASLILSVYEEACYGYIDLKESICDAYLENFLKDKTKDTILPTYNLQSLDPYVANSFGYVRVDNSSQELQHARYDLVNANYTTNERRI